MNVSVPAGNNLTVHSRSHSGEKPFECTVCSKRFTTSDHLVTHSRIHSGEKPYKCLECDKTFSHSGDLNRHTRVHTGDKPYKCSLCDKSFTTSSHLLRHKRSVHSNSRPYDCRYCGKLFKSSAELKCHVYAHTGAKPYSCRHCSECFTWHDQLKRHLLTSHNEGTWFTCNIFEKIFTRITNLRIHIQYFVSGDPTTCRHIKVVYTATEDLMTVVTVGSCLKRMVIWSIMFILTLVQSHTHVDSVQNVLHGMTNSRHICWSHTMKVLDSYFTFVRRSLHKSVTLDTYTSSWRWTEAYVCSQCPYHNSCCPCASSCT